MTVPGGTPEQPGQPQTPQWAPPAAQQWGPPGPQQWPAPVWGPPPRPKYLMPTEPVEYHCLWRSPWLQAWRPVVVLLAGIVGFLLITTVVVMVAVVIEILVNPEVADTLFDDLLRGEVSRGVFVANSVALGLLVPFAFLLQRMMGQRPGFLSSVVGRIRWAWLFTCLGVSAVAVAALSVISYSIEGWDTLELHLHPGWLWLLVAIVVVTPFQAAGEEYIFRGIGNRAVAALIPNRTVALAAGAVVTSIVFAIVHGAADPWLNAAYFIMGMMFCYLTWRTGGLEAAVAMHTANNLLALGLVPFQEWGGIFDRSEGTGGPLVLVQLVFLAAATIIIELLARKRGIARTYAPAGQSSLESRSPM